MIRRLCLLVAVTGLAVAGFAGGTAGAAPGCPDYHWMGAAGSGQRDGANLTANDGMGRVVYQSYEQLSAALAEDGQTMTDEAIVYPATEVPEDGGIGDWMGYMDSVKVGTAATGAQFAAFTQRCPATKVILAGYSQGAMVIHRNLYELGKNPQVAAALLIADGDRLPVDTTIKMGSTAEAPGVGHGVAQEHSFLAGTNTSMLPPEVGARTITVCDVGDPVCDYDPDTSTMSAAELALHSAYAPEESGDHAWGAPLYGLLEGPGSAATAPVALTAAQAAG